MPTLSIYIKALDGLLDRDAFLAGNNDPRVYCFDHHTNQQVFATIEMGCKKGHTDFRPEQGTFSCPDSLRTLRIKVVDVDLMSESFLGEALLDLKSLGESCGTTVLQLLPRTDETEQMILENKGKLGTVTVEWSGWCGSTLLCELSCDEELKTHTAADTLKPGSEQNATTAAVIEPPIVSTKKRDDDDTAVSSHVVSKPLHHSAPEITEGKMYLEPAPPKSKKKSKRRSLKPKKFDWITDPYRILSTYHLSYEEVMGRIKDSRGTSGATMRLPEISSSNKDAPEHNETKKSSKTHFRKPLAYDLSPGPGAYNFLPFLGREGPKFSMYSRQNYREELFLKNSAQIPGPGTYVCSQHDWNLPQRMQFSSRAEDLSGKKMNVPGPGSYLPQIGTMAYSANVEKAGKTLAGRWSDRVFNPVTRKRNHTQGASQTARRF